MDDKYVVLRDEVQNINKENTVHWQIVTRADVNIINKNTAELTLNGKKVILTVFGPKVKLGVWSAQPGTMYDLANTGVRRVGFNSELKPGESAVYTVFFTPEGLKPNVKTVKDLKDWK